MRAEDTPLTRLVVSIVDMDSPTIAAINLEWDIGALERDMVAELGATIREHRCVGEAEIVAAARDADAIMSALVPLPLTTLRQLERCRVISEFSVGTDHIDIPGATSLGMTVCNVPDYGSGEVADHTLAMALALVRRLPQQGRLVAGGTWDALAIRQIPRLRDSTWGVVGYGRIGRAVALRAAAFGFRILAHDPFVSELDAGDPAVLSSLDELLAESDVVSLHAPLTAENSGLIGERALSLMKASAVLVNVARGQLVDEEALRSALDDGRLAGAGLDVLGGEPPPPAHPLLGRDDVIVTPHSAFFSEGSLTELRRKGTQNVIDVLRGERPRYALN